jgi:hypothetical protein
LSAKEEFFNGGESLPKVLIYENEVRGQQTKTLREV